MSQPNVSYFHNNPSMNAYSQKQHNKKRKNPTTPPAITCSELTIETLEQGVKYVQS